jgi:EPS-associated MarR family transcriptional regulator
MTERHLTDAERYHLLRLLENNPGLPQRALANELNISLGKLNYCLNALIEKGWVKARNFRHSANKLGYLYQLTPSGILEKAAVTQRFLERKLHEHERLTAEIAQLQKEVQALNQVEG